LIQVEEIKTAITFLDEISLTYQIESVHPKARYFSLLSQRKVSKKKLPDAAFILRPPVLAGPLGN
jgi:hypothetical protein